MEKSPYVFISCFWKQPNFDGSWVNNCFYFKWHQLNYVSVKKNSNLIHPEIKDSKDAYDMLVKHMNRRNKEMPFPYEDYEMVTQLSCTIWIHINRVICKHYR